MEIKRYFSLFKNLDINHYRVIHSIKTAFACLIGLALERYYKWPMGQWVPITIMVVMSAQTHFGGALRKAIMRFLGTICGVAIVIAVLWFFGENIVIVFFTIFFASLIFTYLASSHGDISYAGTLGGVTVILVLSGQPVGIESAIERGLYIVIGIIIALLVSRFVFPIHARDRFRYHVAKTLRNLSKFYFAAIQQQKEMLNEEVANPELNSKITIDIAEQPRLIDEAVIGSITFAARKPIFNSILNSEQNLSRLVNLLCLSLREIGSEISVKEQLLTAKGLHVIIVDSFNYLADCFEFIKQPQMIVNLDEALINIAWLVTRIPQGEYAKQKIAEYSFLFFIEQILKELENLRKLIAKVNSKNNDSVI